MTWVRRQPPADPHECEPPTRIPSSFVASDARETEHREQVPDGREGDLWRCPTCRRLWLHALGCDRCTWDGYHGPHSVGLILRPVWMPARWWQRLVHARR